MGDDITIRKAVPEDATGIAIVRAYTWATAYRGIIPDEILQSRIDAVPSNAGRLKSLIESGNFSYAVALHNNAVIGFVSYGKSRDGNYPADGETGALYVLKGFAGSGVGSALLDCAKRELAQQGFSHMIVNCLLGNPSLEFYKRMGGIITGQKTDEIFGSHTITENILRFELQTELHL